MSWILLLLAGILEMCWAVGLKYSEGFTRPLPSALTIIAMILSFFLLALAMKTLPLGTAYAIWTGIGAIGTVFAGIFLFEDSVSVPRILCLLLILGGIVGLKFVK